MLLILDDAAQQSIIRLLRLVQACGIRLASIEEEEAAARVTMAIVHSTADELLAVGNHWGRCRSDYAWFTDQLDPDQPLTPTRQ